MENWHPTTLRDLNHSDQYNMVGSDAPGSDNPASVVVIVRLIRCLKIRSRQSYRGALRKKHNYNSSHELLHFPGNVRYELLQSDDCLPRILGPNQNLVVPSRIATPLEKDVTSNQTRNMNETHVNPNLCVSAASRVEGGRTGCATERHAVPLRSLVQRQAKSASSEKKNRGA